MLQCLGVPLPLVVPPHLVVEHHLAQALPSPTTWVPQLAKCSEREQQLPTWEDLGEKLYLFSERCCDYPISTALLAGVLHFYLLAWFTDGLIGHVIGQAAPFKKRCKLLQTVCCTKFQIQTDHCSWNIKFIPMFEQMLEL